MKCTCCDKEVTVHDDGGIAIMMAVCYERSTSLMNNSYCKECYENLIKEHLVALSHVPGMNMPEVQE